jgi:hypothetical protein
MSSTDMRAPLLATLLVTAWLASLINGAWPGLLRPTDTAFYMQIAVEKISHLAQWLAAGKGRYIDKKEFPAVLRRRVGLQLPDTAYQNKPGTSNTLIEKNLAGYRRLLDR